jgi:hypothetical protein
LLHKSRRGQFRGSMRKSCRGHFTRTADAGRVALTSVGPPGDANQDESPGDPTASRGHALGRLARGLLRKSRAAPPLDCPAFRRASRRRPGERDRRLPRRPDVRLGPRRQALGHPARRRAGAIGIPSIGVCSLGAGPSARSPSACPRALDPGVVAEFSKSAKSAVTCGAKYSTECDQCGDTANSDAGNASRAAIAAGKYARKSDAALNSRPRTIARGTAISAARFGAPVSPCRPCVVFEAIIRAIPAMVHGPVLAPPWMRHRPFAIGAVPHDAPPRVRCPAARRVSLRPARTARVFTVCPPR